MDWQDLVALVKRSLKEFGDDDAPVLSAAVAYYTVFSLAPLLVLVVALAALLFGPQAAEGLVAEELSRFLGDGAAQAVQGMIVAAQESEGARTGSIVGIVLLLVGASSVFRILKKSMNQVWDVETEHEGIKKLVVQTTVGVLGVLAVVALLIASIVLTAAIAVVGDTVADVVPGGILVWGAVDVLVSLAIFTVVFAAIFKGVPDADLAWRDTWIGATVTGALFVVGKVALGIYLGASGATNAFGAAGSLAAILIFVFYASAILFFGAEVTQVFSNMFGSGVRPEADARPEPGEAPSAPDRPSRPSRGGTPRGD